MCSAAVKDLASPNSTHVRDDDGCTALRIAARSGNARMTFAIVAALQKGSRFEEVDFLRYEDHVEEGNYRLAAELAAACGHLATVRSFKFGTNVNIGSQLLVAASVAGQLLIVQYLLCEKRFCEGTYEGRACPLELQSLGKRSRRAEKDTFTPRSREWNGHGGQDASRSPGQHQRPGRREENSTAYRCEGRKVKVIELFLEYKANIEACSRTRETPLHLAIRYTEAVKALLEAGSEINAQDNDLRTPVYIAAYHGLTKSLETLLQYKPDLSIVDS
ncbi:hypothetical protein QQX98_008759 [Neonectria punicea]|uniref:Uncharacterized protein n=1 Tax=Neonectria punicea TaxID=979145 RepID=A0ABR1GUA5_9HYPO